MATLADRIDALMCGCDEKNGVTGDGFPGVLYRDEELEGLKGERPVGVVCAEGIMADYGFHPERLEASRPEVVKVIREVVQDGFYRDNGGGMSFLQLVLDRSGELWCEHHTAEAFLCVCMALKLAGWCAPRSCWDALPGGMPFVWFEPLPKEVG